MTKFFKAASGESLIWIFARTLLYAAIIWYLALCYFPRWIVAAEIALGINQFSFPGQFVVAFMVFILFSSINLSAAFNMARLGRGTPLPLDCAPRLVVDGIYRYVRNPMAVGGLGQGLASFIWLGSFGVLVYVLAGMFIWNMFVRPIEERDLLKRFGDSYRDYQSKVKCWIPTFGYLPEPDQF